MKSLYEALPEEIEKILDHSRYERTEKKYVESLTKGQRKVYRAKTKKVISKLV